MEETESYKRGMALINEVISSTKSISELKDEHVRLLKSIQENEEKQRQHYQTQFYVDYGCSIGDTISFCCEEEVILDHFDYDLITNEITKAYYTRSKYTIPSYCHKIFKEEFINIRLISHKDGWRNI